MPFLYPEQLAELRAQHPGIQYDFRGNVVDATPPDPVQMAADAIYQLPGMQPNAWDFGPTRNDYLNSRDFVGPMPQQWWDPSGDLMQQGQDWLGGFMQGRDLQSYRATRPRSPYVQEQGGGLPGWSQQEEDAHVRQAGGMPMMQQARGFHAGAADILKDAAENTWGINPLGYRPPEQPVARPYGGNADELWARIQANPGYNPQSSPRGW